MADQHPTVKLNLADVVVSWSQVVATAEATGRWWATTAVRLGLLAYAERLAIEMRGNPDPALLIELREVEAALSHMPVELPVRPVPRTGSRVPEP